MAGIEDLMNIRTQGGTENTPPAGPPRGGPSMAGPPMGGPSMVPPPGMGGPSMVPPPGMGGPRMAANEPRMDPMDVDGGMSIDGDATALAEAVISRTDGDIASAREVLAKADMILSQADRGPQMAADGGELKAVPDDAIGLTKLPETVRNRMGYMNMGGPLYAAEGRAISDTDLSRFLIPPLTQSGRAMSDKDTDMLRQMIMNSLASEDQSRFLIPPLTQSGRAMSDSDKDFDYFYDKRLDAS